MTKIASENDSRMSLRLRAAEAVAERADRVHLSKRDSLLVLDLLQNPPMPNARYWHPPEHSTGRKSPVGRVRLCGEGSRINTVNYNP